MRTEQHNAAGTKHTAGPWTVDNGGTGAWGIFDDNGQPVAYCSGSPQWGHGLRDEDAANARLIAAAPDMLATLRDFADRLDYLQNLWGAEGFTQRSIEKLREAIARAEGR